MLTIRHQQLAVLGDDQRHRFALELVDHLRGFAPVHAARLGDATLYDLCRSGIERAQHYGLLLRGPVRLYLELMVLLGTGFDTDPQYPWARSILVDRSCPAELSRAEMLHERATGYYDAAIGAGARYEREAICRMTETDLTDFPESDAEFHAEILRRIRTTYPEKAWLVGGAALSTLLARASREARKRLIPSRSGVGLMMAMMFALGHLCVADPQFAWMARSLEREPTPDCETTVRRVREAFLTFLRTGRSREED